MNRLSDTSAFVIPAGQLLLTRRGKTRMYTVGIVFEFYTVHLFKRYIITMTRAQLKIKSFFLPDTFSLAVRLLSPSFAFTEYKRKKSMKLKIYKLYIYIWAIPAETTVYYHQKMKLVLDRFCFYKFYFFYMIMDRCIYLNQDHFVTKLNNCFLISGRTFYPQKLITVTMEKCNC